MLGFIGLGNMGAAIAGQLLNSGADLLVYDVNESAIEQMEQAGAIRCKSIRELADRATLVLVCLPSPSISLAVAREVAEGKSAGILVEFSTIGRATMQEMDTVLKAAGIQLIDAPVSGGPLGAKQGALSLMLSGHPESRELVAQTLKPACGKVTHIGPEPGQAQLGKLVNNGISMTTFLLSCEVVATVVGEGVPADRVIACVNAGQGRNSATDIKIPQYILCRTFNHGPTLISALKDQDLFLDEYNRTTLPGGVIRGTRELWERTTNLLDPMGDAATIVQYFEHYTGAEVISGTGADHSEVPGESDLLALTDRAMAYTVLAATCEAIAVGLGGGIAPDILLALLNAGTGRSYWTQSVFDRLLMPRQSDTGTTIAEACDTLRRFLEIQNNAGIPAGLVSSALASWESVAEAIGSQQDITAMMNYYASIIGRPLPGVGERA